MSLDSRNSSAFIKRAEQLKRWEESDTNREPPTPKNPATKIKFSSGCIFLAACGAGDKEEVKQLLDNGADIDTTNIDGLTALHQACIDDNLDMVEFLISQGADVNKKDNEGWTPLHVTASCDILSIARYLIENGADLASINSDGDLPIDLVGSNEMRELIQKHINEQGIDCDEAKRIEEKIMLEDAKRWLRSDASEADRPHPKTGATALHVAAAKGYAKVLSLLLAGRADVDKQDNDGWTPLHAAAHWGQKEACQMLVASLADMDILNFADQSAIDVAQDDIVPLLEELKKNNKRTKRRPASQIRISDNNIINNADNNAETPSKVIRIDVKADEKKLEEKPKPVEIPAAPVVTFDNSKTTSFSKDKELIQEEEQSWRRSNAIRTREKQESPPKVIPTSDKQVPDKENQPQTTNQNNSTETDVILRRTQSFESDDAFYVRLKELRARIKANSCSNLPVPPQQVTGNGAGNNNSATQLNNFIVQRSASLKDHKQIRKPPTSPPSSPGTTQPSSIPASGVRRSFVPPTRDEESETQRKAHAKRVRETRRSTQGVTLEEIKSAEQLVKKKNSENESVTTVTLGPATTTTLTTSSSGSSSNNDRVPTVPPTAGGEFLELLRRQKEASPPEQVSASYTIVTPSSLIRSRAMSESASDQSNTKVSASYTIAPPSPTAVTTTAALNANKNDSSSTKVATITATYSVPLPVTTTTTSTTHNVNNNNNNNNNLKKTDTETTGKSGSPTVKNRFRWDEEQQQRSTIEESNNSQSGGGGGGDMKAPPVPAQRFHPDFPVHRYVRDKRQIFDLEMSANPLTLAEKLRIEASKYADTTRSSNDLPLARSDSESSDVPKKYDSVPSSPAHHATERRPSWRLRVDAGSKFKLEDTTSKSTTAPTTSTTTAPTSVPVIPIAAQRRVLNTNVNSSSFAAPQTSAPASTASSITITSNSRPLITAPTVTSVFSSRASAQQDEATQPVTSRERHNDHSQPSITSTTATEVTLPLRQRVAAAQASKETEENDKENENRSGQATQGLIQRRRRPKRRSTGVVHLDADDADPDGGLDGDDKVSGGEGRLDSEKGDASENGEFIDYKALYFAEKAQNDQLKLQLNKKDEELASLKAALDRFTNATTKNTLSEIEKRERRAMERKISEMEEELKLLQKFKNENERLRAENRALTRVVSKLTTSAQNQLHHQK